MDKKIKILLSQVVCIAFCLLFFMKGNAQSLRLEKDFLTDYLRNQQLIGATLDSNNAANAYSFAIRPLALNNAIASLYKTKPFKKGVSFLPLVFNSTINSHHPIGQNFGAMLPTASPQVYLSGGIYFKNKRWEFQFQPEIIYSENKEFETFPHGHFDPIWQSYYRWLNKIDAPEQFGTKPFVKAFPGQSKIQYNFSKDVSVGISTQNLWWGPGIRNSLLMTNNAAGFLHLGLQTNKPLVTKWGSIEAQMVFGKLDNSTISPPDTNRVFNSLYLYEPKRTDWRFFTGYTFSFQPKWVPGLFLGASKSTSIYNNDISGPLDVLPFAGLLVSSSEKSNLKATYGSVFFRYLLKEAHAEVYAEYGRNDRGASIVNLITDDQYSRGYVVGLRKITKASSRNIRFEITAEITQLDATKAKEIYAATSWYTNSNVRH
ncbi:MAG: capsule assembly Wzi family protein, partial [Sediminibacterium sp.]